MAGRRGLSLVEVVGALLIVSVSGAWAVRELVSAQRAQAEAFRWRGASRALDASTTADARRACDGSSARSVSWRLFRGRVGVVRTGSVATVDGWMSAQGPDTVRTRRTVWCD
jgi:hypothetical protein